MIFGPESMISPLAHGDRPCESGIGLPHSPAAAGLARFPHGNFVRKVLECGSPMPLFCMLWLASPATTHGQHTNVAHEIDLPTALRLAGAQNLDVQIAREQLAEAKANHAAALAQFFPWISPSLVYRQHDGKLQDSPGNIIDVHKYSYEPGAILAARVDIGGR